MQPETQANEPGQPSTRASLARGRGVCDARPNSSMDIALIMMVCERDEAIAWDVLSAAAEAQSSGTRLTLFMVDDASPSHVGRRLLQRFADAGGQAGDSYEMPTALGFHGCAARLFLGLDRIAASGRPFDMVVKFDPDVCVTRQDLFRFLRESACPNGVGLYGERYPLRRRDAALLLADLLPFGFARKRVGPAIVHKWKVRRPYFVWWSDVGYRALRNGFRFDFITGSFWALGGKTLKRLADSGWFARSDAKNGLLFGDDVLLTMAVHSIGDPIVDLRDVSHNWGFLGTTEDDPIDPMLMRRPYVVHHLKDRPKAWERRRLLKDALWKGRDAADEGASPRAPDEGAPGAGAPDAAGA